MGYCMYFNQAQALHASPNVVRGNISHGCVRLRYSDAKWLRYHFAEIGKRYRGEFVLSDISHAYPEWDKYALLFSSGKTKREDIYYEDFLMNADRRHPMFAKHGFDDPFEEISEDEQADLLEEMREFSSNLNT